jgi:NADH:ubiquinone oxidoreductase subunit
VPPDWQMWLRGTIDDLPEKVLPPVRHFQIPPVANLTGTMAAFRPDGALGSGRIRPASTGDYEPWIPE